MLAKLPINRVRLAVQGCFALFCLYIGFRFFQFHEWATGQSEHFVWRPPAVEGFLPISALLGLKRLLLTGQWDPVHPAGLTILIAALTIAVFFRKGFCGWICPVGFVSNIVSLAGRQFQFVKRLPGWVAMPLLALKYVPLAFFLVVVFVKMDVGAIQSFMYSPYNFTADAKMLELFLSPSAFTIGVLCGLFALTVFLRNFWCRFLCPYGALLGLAAIFGPLRIKRNPDRCVACGKCDAVCPASISISRATNVRHPECIGCMECVPACKQKECLSLTAPAGKTVSVLLMPAAVVGVFMLFYFGALLTDHWHAGMPAEATRQIYRSAQGMGHP